MQTSNNHRWYSQTHLYETIGKTANEVLYEALSSSKPEMITRLGTSELHIILNFISRNKSIIPKFRDYFKGYLPEFWWGTYAKNDIFQNSGFFSNDKNGLEKFANLYLDCLPNADVLLTWLKGEIYLDDYFSKSIEKAYLFNCEPFFSKEIPWTKALENKKVLVIHPFEESIIFQYKKRELLFENDMILPYFDLKTIKAFQTIKGNKINFTNWFDALENLKDQIKNQDFDIALIGAGAYGLPLSAYIKEIGKKSVHLGGFLQLFFGIRGSRWEKDDTYKKIINEHWKFPFQSEYPNEYKKLDHGSYW